MKHLCKMKKIVAATLISQSRMKQFARCDSADDSFNKGATGASSDMASSSPSSTPDIVAVLDIDLVKTSYRGGNIS